MVEPGSTNGHRRRRRRRTSSGRLGISRPVAAFLLIGLVLLGSAGVAIVLSGSPPATPAPSTVARATLPPLPPLATLRPGATPTLPPSASPVLPGQPTPTPSKGPGTLAKRIIIERLKIDLPVVKGDGVDAPLGKAAHYPTSGWPNGGTNIYLYAHARDANFIGLWDAEVGDRIELRLVDQTSKFYVVTKVLPKVKWNALQYLDPTPTEQLTLQTCTSYQYTAPRFLVIAVPEQAGAAAPSADPSATP